MPLKYKALNYSPYPSIHLQHVKHEQSPNEPQESIESNASYEMFEKGQGNQGRWNQDENFKFVLFVQYYQDIFLSRYKRKTFKIFKIFAEYLYQRTSSQCRSHYQKMIIKHKTIAKMKRYYKMLYGEAQFNRQYELFKAIWQETHPPRPKMRQQIKQSREIAIQTDTDINCQRCYGLRSQTTLRSQNQFRGIIGNPYGYWNHSSQLYNSQGVGLYYWFHSIENTQQSKE